VETQGQVKLLFPTAEAAIVYAQQNEIDYHVVPAAERTLKIQAYADNFK
jgi:hypothetical protein